MSFLRLFQNHSDAWIVTLLIVVIALQGHDALELKSSSILLGLTAGYWLAFGLNDYFDARYDAQEPVKAKRNYFVNASYPLRDCLLMIGFATLAVIPLLVSYGARGVVVIGIGLLIAWSYSAPPLRIKNRPIFDLITHALFVECYPYVATLYMLAVRWHSADYAMVLLTLLASSGAQLEQQARDFSIDQSNGECNFTIQYGFQLNQQLLKGVTVALVGATLFFFGSGILPWAYFPLPVLGIPIVLRRLARKTWVPRDQRISYLVAVAALIYILLLLFFG